MGKDMLQRFSNEKVGLLAMLVVSLAFIIIRVAVPIKFDGSYIDEYWHITSGISLFETGAYTIFYNDGDGYDRGLLMSLLVGFWIAVFGKSILVAKLAPLSIAIINYFLVLYLSSKLIVKRRFQLLLLLLYTLSPWLIFNHSYIRFYIVNELFLLILLVLGCRLYNAMRDENWSRISLNFSLILFLNILNFLATKDLSAYIVLLATAVMFSGLFIFELNTGLRLNQKYVGMILGSVLLSNKLYRAVLVLIVGAIGFVVLDAGSKIDFLLNGTLAYSSLAGHKYTWFFWEKNWAITAFFVFAVSTFWWKSSGYGRIVLPVAGVLFLIHILASEDLQIVRGILYFMPLYYFVAVMGVSKIFDIIKLRGSAEWFWFIAVSGFFLVVTLTNVTKNFYYGPAIKYEINYIEYAGLYDAVTEYCKDKVIIEAAPSSPFIAKFYGVNVDYVFSAPEYAEKYGLFVLKESIGKYVTVWGDVPVITDVNELKLLNRDICLTVRGPSKKALFPAAAEDVLKSADQSWSFHNLDLYLLTQKTLRE